jgi:hypothetical protein
VVPDVAGRGYFSSGEILACEEAGITVTLPKPMTSHSKAERRFGKQDFRYLVEEDVYVCPAGERLTHSFATEENGLVLYRYSTNACQSCAIKHSCTTGKERRDTRWEHEHILEAVQRWLTALLTRKPTKVAAIALANKIARMAWAMMARGERYRNPVALAR